MVEGDVFWGGGEGCALVSGRGRCFRMLERDVLCQLFQRRNPWISPDLSTAAGGALAHDAILERVALYS